jgi:SAM-dependent methyltransferase
MIGAVEPEEYDRVAQLEGRHWWYVGMRDVAGALLPPPRAIGVAGRPPRILDVGCGTGGGLTWLAGHGQVTGVDFHPLAARHASRVSSRVVRGRAQALPFAAGAFDLVTCLDVLYHHAVPDDERALAEIARALRPGGWLLLRVPAYDWLRGAHDRQVHTRHRYGRRELRQKLSGAGFEVRRLTGAGLSLLPPAVLRRLLQRNHAVASDVRLPGPTVNRLLAAMLRAESRVSARFDLPYGLSLLAVARTRRG